ncbi:MAG: gephyrin-like molybdotransferase Glp [Ideonella sp.]
MLSLDNALQRLLERIRPLAEYERLDTFEALGRVLAEPIVSLLDVPPADNTSMDGYAMRCVDVPTAGAVLQVSQRIAAGQAAQPLQAGTAARIFTGAQIPDGADAVVMQEQCKVLDDGSVAVESVPDSGQWIRRRGEDVRQGAEVLLAGRRLTPQALGLAASVGAAELVVVRRPKVALFSTGDELVMPGEPLRPGSIYNSNRYTLRALIEQFGCECTDFGIVPDRLDATRDALRRAASGHDLIVTSGGVSVGEEDHLKPAVEAEGRLDLWQIAIKPGKPLAFGEIDGAGAERSTWFIGLPGNPVSSFITFLLAVRPLLLTMQGVKDWQTPACDMRADFDWPKADKRREFMRVRRNADGGLDLFANQSSGVLTSAVWGDGVIDNPPGQVIRRGETVRFISFAEWMA